MHTLIVPSPFSSFPSHNPRRHWQKHIYFLLFSIYSLSYYLSYSVLFFLFSVSTHTHHPFSFLLSFSQLSRRHTHKHINIYSYYISTHTHILIVPSFSSVLHHDSRKHIHSHIYKYSYPLFIHTRSPPFLHLSLSQVKKTYTATGTCIPLLSYALAINTLTLPSSRHTPGTQIGSVGARFDGELEYSIEWGGHESSPPVSVSPLGSLTLTALLDHETDRRLSLIVTATPVDRPELASSTNVILEVSEEF